MNNVEIGPWTQGELPEPLQYAFLDSTGEPIDLTGFSGKVQLRKPDGDVVIRDAIIDQDSWNLTHVWQEDDLTEPGVHELLFWTGNGTNRLASSHYIFRVLRAPAEAPEFEPQPDQPPAPTGTAYLMDDFEESA